ncbi:MAG: antitoxin family protein [Firmicutes bacterium]|nr:antitoxin family protein [Bacillota bacterium]
MIRAIYSDGVLRPLKPLDLKENEEVQLIIITRDDAALAKIQREAFAKITSERHSGLPDLSVNHDKYLYEKGDE